MKKAVRRVLLMSALMSPTALYALGLGEIRLNSALNQPFDAEIELVSAAQEDLTALRASLASSDTFVRYGLDKPAYLSDFTFRVVQSGGRDVLKVTSPRPVTEPFVTLLVEASWPRGRLLREYTVLLDPPAFAPERSAAEAPVAAPRAAAPAKAAAPARLEPAAPTAEAPSEPVTQRPTAAVAAEPGATYTVRRNDTLWAIASAAYPGSRADVNRAMVAIYQTNPNAFGGNINLLRAGSELRMPSSDDVSAVSASAAADEVARQYKMWRESAAAAPDGAADGGRLRLVTPEQGSAAPSTATQPAPTAAADAELQTRVQQLEADLAEARRLLEVRNAELATLQGGTAPAAAPEVPVEGAAPAEGGEAAAPTEQPPVATGPPAEPAPAAQPEPEPTPEAKPVAPTEEPSPGLLDRLREYWWALLALLVAAVGIVAFLRRRRSAASAEVDLEEVLARGQGDLRSRVAVGAPLEPSIVVEERKPVEAAVARGAPAAVAAPAAEPSRKPVSVEDTLSEGPVSIEAGDPLAEADFHMAYGLYDQAADLVQVAAKREPQRRDLKLKLLEIFFVWGNKDRFLEVAREVSASRDKAQPGEWDKVLIMGRQLAPDDPLFAGTVRGMPESLDMELSSAEAPLDMELAATQIGTVPDVDLTGTFSKVTAGDDGLDFMLDEPGRGADVHTALEPTIETTRRLRKVSSDEPTAELPVATTRIRAVSSDDPTAELPIEDLGLDIGELDDSDDLATLERELTQRTRAAMVEDTVERPAIGRGREAEEDLLSTTSITKIMGADTIAGAIGKSEPGVVALSDATGILPAVDEGKLGATGLMPKPDFALDAESATMSEVGTKLDLARAYIDMGDPEGARSILDEVLKEGNANQCKEAERLLAGLP
jgi:pilus assembly protein FimV